MPTRPPRSRQSVRLIKFLFKISIIFAINYTETNYFLLAVPTNKSKFPISSMKSPVFLIQKTIDDNTQTM